LNSINKLIFVMVMCCVLFEVRTEFLNIIYMSFSSEGLKSFLSRFVGPATIILCLLNVHIHPLLDCWPIWYFLHISCQGFSTT